MENLTLFSWTGISIVCSSVFMIITLLLKGKSKIHYILVFFCLAVAIWGIGSFYIGTIREGNKELAISWWRIAHIGVIMIPPIFFHFIVFFLDIRKKYLVSLIYFISVVFLYFCIFTELFIRDVIYLFNEFYFNESPTILFTLFVFYFIAVIIISFYFLWQGIKNNKGFKKSRIEYIFYGLGVSFLGGGLNFLPSFNIEIYPVANFLIFFYPLILGYTILKYKFLDIDLAIRELVKYMFILFNILSILFGTIYILNNWFNIKVNLTIDTLLFIIAFFILLKYFDYFIQSQRWLRNFFSINNLETFKISLKDFIKKDVFYEQISDLEKDLKNIFCKKWIIQSLFIYKENEFNKIPKLFEYLLKNKKILISYDVFNSKNKKYNSIKKEIENGMIFVPLFDWTGKKILAILVLLNKNKKELFLSEKELFLINTSIDHITLSYQILHYNENLKKEVKLKTKALRRSYKKLQKLDEAKDNFLSMASHELRTPMTIIKGYADFLLSEDFGKLNKKQSEFMQYIRDSSEGLLSLVNDMLDLSKIEADRMEIEYEKVDLKKYYTKIFREFEIEAKQKNINFTYSINSKLPKNIILDKQKTHLILMNLIGNAFKFTEKEKNIDINLKQSRDMLCIEVKDQGIGISRDNFDKVFQKFGQIENNLHKNHKGTGLGLSIVKKVVEKMNGKIYFESKIGKGSTFTVELPILD